MNVFGVGRSTVYRVDHTARTITVCGPSSQWADDVIRQECADSHALKRDVDPADYGVVRIPLAPETRLSPDSD